MEELTLYTAESHRRADGPDSTTSDLDETWKIAARGPMPLFLADIHLYRARLFEIAQTTKTEPTALAAGSAANVDQPAAPEASAYGSETTYPRQSPQHDLAEARRLIEKRGYLRRLPEFEDAEAALLPLTNEPTP